jgi:2-polyprenyl-3-methyl-5-hydroxy-6-metoxy-1,4-benzoquinol methylase
LTERFDLVFANQIAEHLVYPEQLIGRLKGLLIEGGKFVVATPNWHYIRNNLPSFGEVPFFPACCAKGCLASVTETLGRGWLASQRRNVK